MTGRCVRLLVGPGFDSVESFFFFFPLLALDLHFFFSPPFFVLLNFFLPFHPALLPFFLSTILFPFVFFLFYFMCPPFCCFSFSFSSLYFIFLISSSFSSPLSFTFFFFFFSSLTQNDNFLWCSSVYSYDRSNWILTDQMYFALSFTLLIPLYNNYYPLLSVSVDLQGRGGAPTTRI